MSELLALDQRFMHVSELSQDARATANRYYQVTGDPSRLISVGLWPAEEETGQVVMKAPPGPPPNPDWEWHEETRRWRNPDNWREEFREPTAPSSARLDRDWPVDKLSEVMGIGDEYVHVDYATLEEMGQRVEYRWDPRESPSYINSTDHDIVDVYTNVGSIQMNRYLRGAPPASGLQFREDKVQDQVDQMSALMRPLGETQVLYRGMGTTDPMDFQPGQLFPFDGFSSTSRNPVVPINLLVDNKPVVHNYVLEIVAGKDSRGMTLSSLDTQYNEDETILDDGQQFVVQEIRPFVVTGGVTAGVGSIGNLQLVRGYIGSPPMELTKAPPGPKPSRFGDDVQFDEVARRWKKIPQSNTQEQERSRAGVAKPMVEEPQPTLGHVRGKVNWVDPIEQPHPKGGTRLVTKGGLLIPPAWQGVKINGDPRGDWQAIGVDKAGQTVALPHPVFVQKRANIKYARVRDFSKELPSLRKQLREDFDTAEEAQVLAIIDATSFRVGGKGSGNFGITTLEGRHVKVKGNAVTFDFVGKKGQRNYKVIKSAKLAKLLSVKKKQVGDKGKLFSIDDGGVRRYMNTRGFGRFNPKDFRTHAGTELAKLTIKELPKPKSAVELKKFKKNVAERVAGWLNNTASVALGSYIDPRVFRSLERSVVSKALDSWEEQWQPEFDLTWRDFSYMESGWQGIMVEDDYE